MNKAHLLAALFLFPLACLAVEPPNVLLIYTDDHAQWAVGAYGNEDVHTPTMDALAAEGMRFDRGFTKPVCSPSRAMVLTGLYSHRLGIPDFIPHGNPVVSGNGLPSGTPTIASVLKQSGYRTGLVGKWHLGYGEKYYPENFGFDDGQMVKVTTEAGEEDVELQVTKKTRPGYIMIPHGFGLVYQGKTYGANANRLAKNTHRDRIAGTPYHRYIRCRVEAV